MDERDFKLLTVLNQTKNITHGADLLYMTQSALSKRITTIEQERICAVYDKLYKGQVLTQIPYIGRKTDITFEREIAR